MSARPSCGGSRGPSPERNGLTGGAPLGRKFRPRKGWRWPAPLRRESPESCELRGSCSLPRSGNEVMSRWFRVYDDLVDDPKVQRLPPALFKHLINVWCIASKSSGSIPPVDELAFSLRITPQKAAEIICDLKAANLLDCEGETLSPHNWSGRQFLSDVSTDRVQKYRDRRRESGLPALADYTKFKPALIERDGNLCIYCEAIGRLVVDHMVPIALGGTDHQDNLGLACKACNSGKAGRTPEQARMTIRVLSAADALHRYRDRENIVTVTQWKK